MPRKNNTQSQNQTLTTRRKVWRRTWRFVLAAVFCLLYSVVIDPTSSRRMFAMAVLLSVSLAWFVFYDHEVEDSNA